MHKLVVLIFILFATIDNYGQHFGGNPPSLSWRKIESDTARIIFPEGLDSQANRIASVVHFLAAQNISLGNKTRKVNLLLQNQTTIANGYAGLGPYRSEFFMTPSFNNFDLGSTNWADALAVHEYRHIQQYNNFKQGASDAAYHFFGEEGFSLAINAAVPDWFFEGDAVYNETVQTQQGRGRIPFFTNQYKALWVAKKNYSWMKLRNGSLKNYIPSHYPLGFLLINYGHEKYNADFWKKVTFDAVNFKGLIYPFQKAVKKYSGVSFNKFRDDAFSYYKQLVENTDSLISGNRISITENSYKTDCFHPFQIGDDSLLYLKSSVRSQPSFFIKTKNEEKEIFAKDISLDENFSYRNGKIVYAYFKPDIRWGWKNYSNIKIVDIKTGVSKNVTRQSKYFEPDISEDGKKIITVHFGTDGKSELHLLDVATGEVLKRIAKKEISLFTGPKFIDEFTVVSATRMQDGRMSLMKINIFNAELHQLTPFTYSVLGFINVEKKKIYFTASYTGNDELFELDLQTNQLFQLTNSLLGNYFANVSGEKLLYSTFTANGFQLKQKYFSEIKKKEVDWLQLNEFAKNNIVNGIKTEPSLQLNLIPNRNFKSQHYKKTTNMFNFHSWRPNYDDPEITFSLYGENVLNTFQSNLFYLYNQNDRTSAIGYDGVYGALFPFISVGTLFTVNKKNSNNKWNQLDSKVGVSIPLNFTSGKYFRYLNFGTNYYLRNEFYQSNNGTKGTINFAYLTNFLSYSHQTQKSLQDIYPKKGVYISLNQIKTISRYSAYQIFVSSAAMLPGIINNHHLVLTASFQQRDTLNPNLFSNRFAYSRGFSKFYFSRMWRVSGNYHFPILLPDWGFANILYVSRIRANAFYDFTKLYSRNKMQTINQRSAGCEIYFDTKWWNQHPLTFGFRMSYLIDKDLSDVGRKNKFEIILPINIIPK